MSIGPFLEAPGAANDYHTAFLRGVLDAFARVTGQDLVAQAGIGGNNPGRDIWQGDFALLTHRGDADAMLNYGNVHALGLWEMDWNQFIATPSRDTAPAQGREARAAMMAQVQAKGFVSGYSGVRISRTGRQFLIRDVTIWRLRDAAGTDFGVAAFFRDTENL